MEQHDNIGQIRAVVSAIFAQQQRDRRIIRAEIDTLPKQAKLIAEKLYEGCTSPRYAADYLASFASPANVDAELAAIARASEQADEFVLGLMLLKGTLPDDDRDEWGKR